MKHVSKMLAVLIVVAVLLPCFAEEPTRGVKFVLKIDATGILNEPQELAELVEAYGSQEDFITYEVRVTNANLGEGPYSLSVFIEEIASDTADASVFAQGLVDYMDQTVGAFYSQTRERLNRRLETLTNQKLSTQDQLKTLRAETTDVLEISPGLKVQLDTIIDLQDFTPELPAATAFDVLRESVSPPLNIVVLWKDLLDNAETEPTTPIDMDGIPEVSVGTALDVLLKALGGGYYELAYTVQDSVIVVGTRETQQALSSNAYLDLASAEYTSTSDINQQRRELMHQIDNLGMDISRQQASDAAVETEVSQIQDRINKALANDPVLKDFESLVTMMQTNLEAIKDKNPDEYVSAMERMVSLRMKVAEHKSRLVKQTGGEDLARFSKEILFSGGKLAGDMAELRALKKQLTRVEKELAQSVRLRSAVNEIKTTEEALVDIDGEIANIQTLIASLEEPSVTSIGL